MSKRVILVLLCATALGIGPMVLRSRSAQMSAPKRRVINLPGKAANLPFSDGVLVGDTLYLAGRIGTDPQTGNAPSDVDEEIKLLLDGVQSTLAAAGMGFDDLVSVQVYCTDLSLYARFNSAYAARFKKDFPARMFVGASQLLRNGHFELISIAAKR
jgi:enamine deaminase RidA (YjgF/YER057c/UK114 family)